MTPWTAACQAPLSMGFSRQEFWNGLPCPLPGDLPSLGIETRSPALQVGSLLSEPPEKPKNTRMDSLSLPGDLLDPGIKLGSPTLQVDSLSAELPEKASWYLVCILTVLNRKRRGREEGDRG